MSEATPAKRRRPEWLARERVLYGVAVGLAVFVILSFVVTLGPLVVGGELSAGLLAHPLLIVSAIVSALAAAVLGAIGAVPELVERLWPMFIVGAIVGFIGAGVLAVGMTLAAAVSGAQGVVGSNLFGSVFATLNVFLVFGVPIWTGLVGLVSALPLRSRNRQHRRKR